MHKISNNTQTLHKYTQTTTNSLKTSTDSLNFHKIPTKPAQRRETTTALLSHLAGDGWLKGRINKTSRHRSLKGTCISDGGEVRCLLRAQRILKRLSVMKH